MPKRRRRWIESQGIGRKRWGTVTAPTVRGCTFECFLEIRSGAFFDTANAGQVERAVAALFVGGRHARPLHLVGRR